MPPRLAKGRWLSFLFLSLVLGAAAADPGLFYRLEKPGRPVHYLLGTMHSDDPRVLSVADRVRPQLEEVAQVALEILPDGAGLFQAGLAMLLPPGQRLSELLGPDLYRQVESAMARKGVPSPVLERLKPWAVAVVLGTPPLHGEALDQRLYREALALGREAKALETPEEQLALFDELSPELQKRMVEEVLAQQERLKEQLEQLTAAYLAGDLERLQRLSLEYDAAGDEALARWFRERLIRRRNHRMAERLLPLLERDATLVAVGALHLPGNEGLIKLLESAGYRATPLF